MLCVELVVSQIGGCEMVGASRWVRGIPGANTWSPLPLRSVCLYSNLKLSFLSRKQMFLLSFSNFRVYF